jgi:hypothetical protein
MENSIIIKVAKENNLEPAAVKSVIIVESGGNGFLNNKLPKILFEGHIFWKELLKHNINPKNYIKGNENIIYQKWTKQYYSEDQYKRLEKAKLINEESALLSTSWGLFQIMGFNFKSCSYNNVFDYVKDMYISEEKHLQAFINFIISDSKGNKYNALKNKNWKIFASLYNGPKYAENKYDVKLEKYYKENIILNN